LNTSALNHISPVQALPSAGLRRLDSVDLLRGIVMILMALDHVRYFFTNLPFQPENMSQTYPALFFTRWVTHFCAPVFFLLAGTGSYLAVASGRHVAEVGNFLWKRGLWLVFLELTLIGFAWVFSPAYSFGGVIWCLGWSMIVLSGLVRLPPPWIAFLSIGMIALHNLFDSVISTSFGRFAFLWSILHVKGPIEIGSLHYFVLFPLIPLAAVMGAGYALGWLLKAEPSVRQKNLLSIGLIMIVVFVILRITNAYGNPTIPSMRGAPDVFRVRSTPGMTIVAFLNVEKYPPSLQFLLMTLGPSLVGLALLDRVDLRTSVGRLWKPVFTFGRVPMFYYVLHLYWIHCLAWLLARLLGQPSAWLAWHGSGDSPPGYGHGLPFIYAVFILSIVVLYFPCRWMEKVKKRRKDWWLRYI
jgi:uncharacterized membrane protein